MSKFERKFFQRSWDRFPVINTLLEHWALPGFTSHKTGLRVAVRKNYVNFYRRGQSVAKLHSTHRLLRLSVHEEYVAGTRKHDRGEMKKSGYVDFDEAWLSNKTNATCVRRWISCAESYAGAEKSYVDELVAANPGVVDIEMGLPAYEGEKNAPRMDLVLIENGAAPSLAFWEAKCADNSEARAKGEPKVVEQVQKYERWMAKPGRKADVVEAYRQAAAILLDLATTAGKPRGPAQEAWRSFHEAPKPKVVGKPGVVIGGYCPEGYQEGMEGNIEQRAGSLIERGHMKRLTDSFGLHVTYHATSAEASKTLPRLQGDGS